MSVDYATNPAVFNKEILILNEHITEDAFHSPHSEWHPVGRVRASIEPLRGREYWNASQSQSEATVRIIIRYREGITARSRIMYKSPEGVVVFELRSPPINYLESNRFLELMCRELSRSEEKA